MKAIVVFVHPRQPLVVLQFAHGDFVIVRTQSRAAMFETDDISGDPNITGVKWFLNITHSTLINIQVLGRYTTRNSAVEVAVQQSTHKRMPARHAFVTAHV